MACNGGSVTMKITPFLLILGSFVLTQAAETNNYDAPFAPLAPIIDGKADSTWDLAPWDSINHTWLGGAIPDVADFRAPLIIHFWSNRLRLFAIVRQTQSA